MNSNLIIATTVVLAAMVSVVPITAPAAGICSPSDKTRACSAEDYKSKMCLPFSRRVGMVYESRKTIKEKDVKEYLLAEWASNLKSSGKIGVVSEGGQEYIREVYVPGIFKGTWKNGEEFLVSCMSEGSAFPPYLRRELAQMKKFFGGEKKREMAKK